MVAIRASGLASAVLVLCVALATPAGGGFARCESHSSSMHGRPRFPFHPTAASIALVASLALSSLPTEVRAATHLRVDTLNGGVITHLPLADIPEDVVKFHMPVQHPGARKPSVDDPKHAKQTPKEKWQRVLNAWTSLGVFQDRNAGNGTADFAREVPSYGLDDAFSPGRDESMRSPHGPNLGAGDAPGNGNGNGNTGGNQKTKTRLRPEPALAVLFDRYGGVDNAFEVLHRATRENPSDPVMWSDLGNAYRVKGESDLAVWCFERALAQQRHPDFYRACWGFPKSKTRFDGPL